MNSQTWALILDFFNKQAEPFININYINWHCFLGYLGN